MNTRYVTAALAGCLVLCQGLAAQVALADDTRIAVVGLQAPDGDDNVARRVTDSLRAQAARMDGWSRLSANQTLDQLMLVNGCVDANPACFALIASGLKADALITGEVKRSSRGKRYHYVVQTLLFDARSGKVQATVKERLLKSRADAEGIYELSNRALTEFGGEPPSDAIVIGDVVESPIARIDDSDKPDTKNDKARSDKPKKAPKLWPALTLYGVTAASLGMLTWNWLTIKSVEDDAAFQRARVNAGPAVGDVCASPNAFGEPTLGSLCDKAKLHETLQYVSIATAAVSAGLGTWLLVRHLKGKSKDRAARLQLVPHIAKSQGGMSAHLTF